MTGDVAFLQQRKEAIIFSYLLNCILRHIHTSEREGGRRRREEQRRRERGEKNEVENFHAELIIFMVGGSFFNVVMYDGSKWKILN
jgi:hypothetical protein